MNWLKKLWEQLRKPNSQVPVGILLLGGFLAGVVGWVGFNGLLGVTSSTEFCISCHEMRWPYEEYKKTVHYSNRSGVRVGCSDCHVPQADSVGGWFAKMRAKIMAAKDTYHHILGTYNTPEKFEKGRWEMAQAVWAKMRARGAQECLNCHDYNSMDPEKQDRMAQRKHGSAMKDRKICIDCHTGIAHKLPEEPRTEKK
ncbi:MAG: NapC/NirT family cytochrome c [Magnetococcales bacterium]|nr:NapC/NirT family cytochrome c [Magnetococcales bacterium]MBF0321671.1 NapC/NirT family cytochrome c [Magnetococcales bacterium]